MLNGLLEKKNTMLALFCIQFLLYYFVKKKGSLLVTNIFPKGKYLGEYQQVSLYAAGIWVDSRGGLYVTGVTWTALLMVAKDTG